MPAKRSLLLALCGVCFLALFFVGCTASEEQLCYMEWSSIDFVQDGSTWVFNATAWNVAKVHSEFRLVGSHSARGCQPTPFSMTNYGAIHQMAVEELANDECVMTVSDNSVSTQTVYIEEKQFSKIDNCKIPNGEYNRRRILCVRFQTDLTITSVMSSAEQQWVQYDSACTGPCVLKTAEHKVELGLFPNDVVYTTGEHVFVGLLAATISPKAFATFMDNATWIPLNASTNEPMMEYALPLVVGGEAMWGAEMSDDKSGFQFEVTYADGLSTPKYTVIGDLKLIPTFEDNPYRRWILQPVRDLMRMITNRRSDDLEDETDDAILASPFRRDFAVLPRQRQEDEPASGTTDSDVETQAKPDKGTQDDKSLTGPTDKPAPDQDLESDTDTDTDTDQDAASDSDKSEGDSAGDSDRDPLAAIEPTTLLYIITGTVIATFLCTFGLVLIVTVHYCCVSSSKSSQGTSAGPHPESMTPVPLGVSAGSKCEGQEVPC